MISIPMLRNRRPVTCDLVTKLEIGDIVMFDDNSCCWAFHCGLLDDHHGIGSLGLVVKASEEEGSLFVFLLDYHKHLSEWDNCLMYGTDSGASFQDAADDICAVVTPSPHTRSMSKWISQDATHSLYRIYFERMMRAAQDELDIPNDVMLEIREDTNDFDLGGWASVNCELYEGTLGEVLDVLDSSLIHGFRYVRFGILDWLDDKKDGDLDPEQLLDVIEAMQQDRALPHQGADRLLRVWGRGVNASGVIRQGFAGASCAEGFNGSQK